MHNYLIIANYILILVAALVAVKYLSNTNKIAVYIFCFLAALFGLIDHYIPNELGFISYMAAALTDLLVIYLLTRLANPTDLISKIQKLCIYFIIVNFVGWIMYMAYMEPIYYTGLCLLLYLRMIVIANGSGNALGNNSIVRWGASLFSGNRVSNYNLSTNKTETGN